MTPARWRQVERIYLEALAFADHRREALLDRRCATDTDLRRDVESLLAQSPRVAQFLEARPWADVSGSPHAPGQDHEEPCPPVSSPAAGLFAGRYRLVAEIGAGGMGVVYRAEDVRLKRSVALKFLNHSRTAGPAARAQFLHEAQAAAALSDPHVCTVYEAGEHDGQAFIAMALIEGPTLKEHLASGPLPVHEAIAIARDVAAGLAAAHARGVVHRDIKPGNILLGAGGLATITDFGLARLARDDDALLPDGGGTPAYMSPEQLQGLPIDHRTDIWALGCVIHEMLTGRSPFVHGRDSVDIFAIVNESAAGLMAARPDTPPALAAVVSRCLERDMRRRYQSASGALMDLVALQQNATGSMAPVVTTALARPSIAVLPFADMSPDRSLGYFAEGMADEIIHALGRIDGVRVVARTSAFAVRARGLDVREIGRVLGVGTVLEGSVRTSGPRLRVTAHLVDADDGCRLWSERFDREARDIFAIQDEITASIVAHLEGVVSAERVHPEHRPADHEAYAHYLKGQYFFNRPSPGNLDAALRFYSDAAARDPAFARAHAGIAGVWTDLCVFKAVPPHEGWPEARTALDRALALDPTLPEALVIGGTIGLWHDWDWAAAEAAFARALAQNPSDAFGRGAYANLLMIAGRVDASLAAIEQALVDDPLSPLLYGFSTGLHAAARRPARALADFARAKELAPGFGLAHVHAALAYLAGGRLDDAAEVLEHCPSEGVFPGWIDCVLGVVRARQGARAATEDVIARMVEQDARGYASSMGIGWALAALGDRDAAFHWFHRACEQRDGFVAWIRVYSEIFVPGLSRDPRFSALLERLHLPRMA